MEFNFKIMCFKYTKVFLLLTILHVVLTHSPQPKDYQQRFVTATFSDSPLPKYYQTQWHALNSNDRQMDEMDNAIMGDYNRDNVNDIDVLNKVLIMLLKRRQELLLGNGNSLATKVITLSDSTTPLSPMFQIQNVKDDDANMKYQQLLQIPYSNTNTRKNNINKFMTNFGMAKRNSINDAENANINDRKHIAKKTVFPSNNKIGYLNELPSIVDNQKQYKLSNAVDITKEMFTKRTPKQLGSRYIFRLPFTNILNANDDKMLNDLHNPYNFERNSENVDLMPYVSATLVRNNQRNWKREKNELHSPKHFIPSISAGAMTNLGDFFNALTKNVQYTENIDLQPMDKKIREIDHPFHWLDDENLKKINNEEIDSPMATDVDNSASKTTKLLHAMQTYRPSQKIRSLVAMNPRGYHGSYFIDPNYMWLGLGK